MSNLPEWSGAQHCYSKAYKVLENMASRGHVTKGRSQCFVSDEMTDLIKALDKGDEETIKGLLAYDHIYF